MECNGAHTCHSCWPKKGAPYLSRRSRHLRPPLPCQTRIRPLLRCRRRLPLLLGQMRTRPLLRCRRLLPPHQGQRQSRLPVQGRWGSRLRECVQVVTAWEPLGAGMYPLPASTQRGWSRRAQRLQLSNTAEQPQLAPAPPEPPEPPVAEPLGRPPWQKLQKEPASPPAPPCPPLPPVAPGPQAEPPVESAGEERGRSDGAGRQGQAHKGQAGWSGDASRCAVLRMGSRRASGRGPSPSPPSPPSPPWAPGPQALPPAGPLSAGATHWAAEERSGHLSSQQLVCMPELLLSYVSNTNRAQICLTVSSSSSIAPMGAGAPSGPAVTTCVRRGMAQGACSQVESDLL